MVVNIRKFLLHEVKITYDGTRRKLQVRLFHSHRKAWQNITAVQSQTSRFVSCFQTIRKLGKLE